MTLRILWFLSLASCVGFSATSIAMTNCGEYFGRSQTSVRAQLWSASIVVPEAVQAGGFGSAPGAIAPGLSAIEALSAPGDDPARALPGASVIEGLRTGAFDLRSPADRARGARFRPIGENAGQLAALIGSALQGFSDLERQEVFESALQGRPIRRALLERALETLPFEDADDLALKLRVLGFITVDRGVTAEFWARTEFAHPERPGYRSLIVAPPAALGAMTELQRVETRVALLRGLSYRVRLYESQVVSP